MHKLDENLLNNTYRIQAPVSFNEHGENKLKVLSYQTDKVYEVVLKGCNDIRLSTFFRLCHQADIRNEAEETSGETMVVDRNVV
jgi:hypothetical protein